jgi:hypothetical protein
VHGALTARLFQLAEDAVVEALMGVAEQPVAVVAESVAAVMVMAVDAEHRRDGPLLAAHPAAVIRRA